MCAAKVDRDMMTSPPLRFSGPWNAIAEPEEPPDHLVAEMLSRKI
jgi:hypothetical protein